MKAMNAVRNLKMLAALHHAGPQPFEGGFTDKRQGATRLPNFSLYFILTLNFGATTRQKPRDIKKLYPYNFYHFIARLANFISPSSQASTVCNGSSIAACLNKSVNAPQ